MDLNSGVSVIGLLINVQIQLQSALPPARVVVGATLLTKFLVVKAQSIRLSMVPFKCLITVSTRNVDASTAQAFNDLPANPPTRNWLTFAFQRPDFLVNQPPI
jgi:hypothetical protein